MTDRSWVFLWSIGAICCLVAGLLGGTTGRPALAAAALFAILAFVRRSRARGKDPDRS